MAKTSSKGSLLARKLKNENIREETRHKEAEAPKGGSLPPGIEGGIARIRTIKFSPILKGDNKGDVLLYVDAIAVEPKEFTEDLGDGRTRKHKIEGRMVQFGSITIGDVKGRGDSEGFTFAEQWAKAENRLKLCGIPMEDIEDDEIEEVVPTFAEENELYVRFRTWQGQPTKQFPNPRVNVVLEGPEEDYEAENIDDMNDEEEEEEEVEVETKKVKTETKNTSAKPKKEPEPSQGEEEEEEDQEEGDDEAPPVDEKSLRALAKKADKNNKAAQESICEVADAYGVDPEAEEHADWADVVEAIIEVSQGGEEVGDDEEEEEEEEGDEGEIVPKVEELYFYRAPRTKVAVEFEVTKVSTKAKTVSLKSIDKPYKAFDNVAWDKLQTEE